MSDPAFTRPADTQPSAWPFPVELKASDATLRDYFAVHGDQPGMAEIVAAAGLTFSAFKVWRSEDVCLGTFDQWWATVAQKRRFELYAAVRYLMADAMLKARAS